mmetsp:Transcript_6498/g.24420  ORF Transcript_6498/g.24420 Transcript_6498/m.24420 type:complete len:128 (+) Transcript_6498:78-461(+)
MSTSPANVGVSPQLQQLIVKRDQLKQENARLREVVRVTREGLKVLKMSIGLDFGENHGANKQQQQQPQQKQETPRLKNKRQFYEQLHEFNSTVQTKCNEHRNRFDDLIKTALERARNAEKQNSQTIN